MRGIRNGLDDRELPTLQFFSESQPIKSFEFSKPRSGHASDTRKLKKSEREIYQTNPILYAKEILGVTAWEGRNGADSQKQLFEDIGDSVQGQLEGRIVSRIFRVEAAHGVGKTYGAAALVNWFFDCFVPSIAITTAPTKEQVEALLWKNIKKMRPAWLPGRVLPGSPRIDLAADHFAYGRTTHNAGGKGTERFQGQHDRYLLFVLDEAEGIEDYVFDSIDAMMTGGEVIIVLLFANPRTRTSRFHKIRTRSDVKNYRFSALEYPNVIDGQDTITGGTSRQWVESRIELWCEEVLEHDHDECTFEVNFPVTKEGKVYPPGTIWHPNAECCFRVLGVAPANLADDIFISPGRFESAKKRAPLAGQEGWARIGIDVGRYGNDSGTIYVRHAGKIWRERAISKKDTHAYTQVIKDLAPKLAKAGVTSLHVRVDGSGGFGSGIIDNLKIDEELQNMFEDFMVLEVQFGSSAFADDKYANKVTEMYAESAATLLGVRLENIPNELEGDLTERPFDHINRAGKTLKVLTDKNKFKRKHRRSPDDGDGFVLAASPDFIFEDSIVSQAPTLLKADNEAAVNYRPEGF